MTHLVPTPGAPGTDDTGGGTGPGTDDGRPEATGDASAEAADAAAGAVDTPHTGSRVRRFVILSLRAVGIYVASRIGMTLVATAVASDVHQPVLKSLTPWDSYWYLQIARSGYVDHIPPGHGNPAQSDLGFFPLIPLVTRATHLVTGTSWEVAGVLTTFLLGLAAAVAVWWMLHDLFGRTGADRGTALVFFSPGALVLSMVYSEAGTILFVACALLALRRSRWVVAGLCAAVATTADPVGAAAIVPCVVAAVLAIRRRGEWKALLAPLLAPLGIGSFFAYLWAHTGTPFEYFHAQRAGWQGGTFFNGIPGSFAHLFSGWFADPDYAVKAVSALVAVALLVVFFRARPPGTWIGYVLAVLAFGAISPVIGVTPRLVLRGFPLLGVVGAKLPPVWFEAVLGLSALCMAALGMMAMGGPLWTP
jgi:hypothetical protein